MDEDEVYSGGSHSDEEEDYSAEPDDELEDGEDPFDIKDEEEEGKVVLDKVKEWKVISGEDLVKTQQKHLRKVHNVLGIPHSLARMLLTHYQWYFLLIHYIFNTRA